MPATCCLLLVLVSASAVGDVESSGAPMSGEQTAKHEKPNSFFWSLSWHTYLPRPGKPTGECPFPALDQVHEKYLNDVLAYWEKSSGGINRFSANLQRWEYDDVNGPRDTYNTFSTGLGFYEAPDKWSYKIVKVLHSAQPRATGEKPKFVARDGEYGDHWVCNGQSLFNFKYSEKRLFETTIPVESRGRLPDFPPFPFLFEIKAERLKERFWIRVITPEYAKGEYWLEFSPKYRRDGAWFKKADVIIDDNDFFPKAIKTYSPAHNDRHTAYVVLAFTDRLKNGAVKEIDFKTPILTPKGWERIVDNEGKDAMTTNENGKGK